MTSFNSIFLNGTQLNSADWLGGVEPFDIGTPPDSIITVSPGNALANPATGNSVQGQGIDGGNGIFNFVVLGRTPLGNPTSSLIGLVTGDVFIAPTSTTFTTQAAVIPVPSAFLLMGTGLLGLIGYRKWSSKKN